MIQTLIASVQASHLNKFLNSNYETKLPIYEELLRAEVYRIF
jgi:hypothetical protein